jgi:hypothetical protein
MQSGSSITTSDDLSGKSLVHPSHEQEQPSSGQTSTTKQHKQNNMRTSEHNLATSMSNVSRQEFKTGIESQPFCLWELWRSSAFTDITIVCGNHQFPLHRCVLSTQCDFFAHACRHAYISTPNGDILEMDSENPTALRAMFQYFYTGELEVPLESLLLLGGAETPSIETLLEVYKLACKHGATDLKLAVEEQYCSTLAKKYPKGSGILLAKGLMATFSDGLADADSLRAAALDVAARHSQELIGDRVVFDLLEGEPLRALMMKLVSCPHLLIENAIC